MNRRYRRKILESGKYIFIMFLFSERVVGFFMYVFILFFLYLDKYIKYRRVYCEVI